MIDTDTCVFFCSLLDSENLQLLWNVVSYFKLLDWLYFNRVPYLLLHLLLYTLINISCKKYLFITSIYFYFAAFSPGDIYHLLRSLYQLNRLFAFYS